MSELEKAFLKFANYGNTSTPGNVMTDKNFSKMCQECGVMDGTTVNSDDVKIAFNKVRAKGARTINYIEFLQAMKVLCGKRFSKKSPEDALQATFKLLEGKEPADGEATKSVMAGGVERPTGNSKCLGSPMQHFDKSGKDKGISGLTDLAQSPSNIRNCKGSGT
uniref:tubulin polymerization-promoting protein family member 2-like n=1 Tax=Euleptes europaea TaxID=460621 RepID=UPI0025424D6D|nr:tubulin polymerization-promoting protein family member 2-like [Euleptes europaea]